MYAIIGLGFRLPGHTNTQEQLYKVLYEKLDTIEEIPKNRWNADFYQHPDKSHPGTTVHRRGGFLDPYYEFDNDSFQMSMKEAKSLDPSTKILLEVTLETFEDANTRYRGSRTGCFIGTGQQGFSSMTNMSPEFSTQYSATGSEIGIQANMISYKFDLRGPSMAIDTACSSAATALYTAINSLKTGDIDMALIGGFNHLLDYGMSVCFSRLGVLSSDGRCKSFDKDANGYVRSEGCGMILVKPLEKAVKDGNHIYCIIKGVVANEDGALEPSLTKPSSRAQERVIRETLRRAKVSPENVFYFEAHATGTQVGDPAECKCIGKICSKGRSDDSFLKVGSVKTNLGHLEMASFVASLAKCCVMYDKGVLLPTIVNEINPKLEMKENKMVVQTEPEIFDPAGKIFVVNSFGFGGANACCVLEGVGKKKYEPVRKILPPPFLFVTSGRTEATLNARITQMQEFSKKCDDQYHLSYSMNTKVREGDKYFSYCLGEKCHESRFSPAIRIPDDPPKICFVFSGQGPQNLEMGRQLYKQFPAFRASIDKCDSIYQKYSGKSIIKDVGLFGEHRCEVKRLGKIDNTLAGLMFMQVGLFELLKSFGVHPDVICGHSFGEMVSFYANGSVSLNDIIKVAFARGKVCQTLESQGKMLAVGVGADEIEKIIDENEIRSIWVAADNSPVSCTVGGINESVQKLDKICAKMRIFHRILSIPNAFHTPLLNPMKEAAEKLFPILEKATPPKIPFFSTVTKEFFKKIFSKSYMWSNISQRVQFRSTIETIMQNYGKDVVFIEIAPQPVLTLSMKQCGAKNVIFMLQKNGKEQSTILSACGKIMGFGYNLSWENIMGKMERKKLPLYPFQRKNCFLNIEHIDRERFVPEASEVIPGPLLGRKQDCSSEIWNNLLNTKKYNWLMDHVVQKSVIFPAAGFVEMFLELKTRALSSVKIHNPLLVPTEDNKYVVMETRMNEQKEMKIFSRKQHSNEWTLHATATKSLPKTKCKQINFESVISRCKKVTEKNEIYQKLDLKKLSYGHYFQLLEKIYCGDDEGLMIINTNNVKNLPHYSRFAVHPSILDCAFQGIELLIGGLTTFLPTSIKNVTVYPINGHRAYRETKREEEWNGRDSESLKENEDEEKNILEFSQDTLFCYGVITDRVDNNILSDLKIFTANQELLMEISGLECTRAMGERVAPKMHYTTIWQEKKMSDLFLEKFVDEKEDEKYLKFEQNVPGLINMIFRSIKKGLLRLQSLSIPKEKHSYLNWITNKFREYEKKKGESNVDTGLKSDFGVEMSLVENVTKHFPSIVRNKSNTEEKLRKNLINDWYRKSVSYLGVVENLKNLFTAVGSLKGRVVRILELSGNFGSYSDIFLPIIDKNLQGRVEVFLTEEIETKKTYPYVEVKKIDISKKLIDQGILANSIDVVLCSGSSFSEVVVNNIKTVLVDCGILFVVQPTEELRFFYNYIFGAVGKYFQNNEGISKREIKQILKVCELQKSKVIKSFGNYIIKGVEKKKIRNGIGENIPVHPSVDVFDCSDSISLLNFSQKHSKERSALVVTRNVYDEVNGGGVEYSANVGLFRVITNEYPEWDIKMVDLCVETKERELFWIKKISCNFSDFEKEFCVKENNVFVPRLVKISEVKKESVNGKNFPYRLNVLKPGILNSLTYLEFEKPVLKPREVYVKVKSASLNFKDLMLAQNMLKDFDCDLGLEFSGEIVEVGSSVVNFKIGDAVFGFGDNSLASHVVTSEKLIVKKPREMSWEDAAGLPTVFITPYYALVKKADISEGEYVLIHSAAGGVGQAAVQLVNNFGGIPICTCGTEEKRQFLKKNYGVNIFADSHSQNWDKEIIKQLPSEKKGVDIILNSLAKENIKRGLSLLNPFGSFIEIGKRDILSDNKIGLLPFLNNLSYYSVHLDKMIESKKDLVGKLLGEISEIYTSGKIRSVVDKVFSCDKILEAFRFMQSGKHKGKIIINFDDNSNIKVE